MQVVYTDIHRETKYEMELEFEEGAIYLGDIFDVTGCKKRRVKKTLKKRQKLKELAGENYIDGNHEGHIETIDDRVIKRKTLYRHGDEEFWGRKKAIKFRSKKRGKGFIGRYMSKTFDVFRMLKPFKMSQEAKERAADSCVRYNCHTLCLGHNHPHSIKDFTFYSRKYDRTFRFIILPRGRHELDL